MKIPRRVKVGGHWVKVIYPYRFEDDYNHVGQADYNSRTIKLSDHFKGDPTCESELAGTFIHELFHQILSIYYGKQIEEEPLEQLAQGLFQVLRDNDLDFRRK